MSKVEFRAKYDDDTDKWHPVIAIEVASVKKWIEFECREGFDHIDDAKQVLIGSYMALTGKQHNLKYSETGDA